MALLVVVFEYFGIHTFFGCKLMYDSLHCTHNTAKERVISYVNVSATYIYIHIYIYIYIYMYLVHVYLYIYV